MADRIYIRAWKKDEGTVIADREIAFVRKDKTLCIGTPDGVVEFVAKGYVDSVVTQLNAKIDALSNPSE